jgi:tyrosine aminotransferase
MALWGCLNVLADAGDNILIPKPGFPLIMAMAENKGIEVRYYDLDINSEIIFDSIKIDEKTKFFLINNPSNPLGSNWSKD